MSVAGRESVKQLREQTMQDLKTTVVQGAGANEGPALGAQFEAQWKMQEALYNNASRMSEEQKALARSS